MSLPNLAQAIAWASERFDKSSDSPKLDAQVLLLHVIGKPRSYLYGWSDESLTELQYTQFKACVARREKGEPVAHITGTKEFWSLPFFVDSSTLIPRPDTETVVEYVLGLGMPKSIRLLDLGTGTGAIALSLASEQPNWDITAIDYSEDAVSLAKRNQHALDLPHVKILQGSWFEPVMDAPLFDVIVSNPPYIDPIDPHLSQGDVRFEPLSALIAPENGFADLRHIIENGAQYLKSGGVMVLEHGYDQATVIQNFFAQFAYINILTIKDIAGCDRITVATKP
ncbi:Methylase of polypeptide chain release factors [Pseudoalteromonas luteoviolacea B = ATCC 29581]|nr:Methylase of polypeptide chain release factors [Pseudoalteromonas luteoviolacea B = ATCC 29581]